MPARCAHAERTGMGPPVGHYDPSGVFAPGDGGRWFIRRLRGSAGRECEKRRAGDAGKPA